MRQLFPARFLSRWKGGAPRPTTPALRIRRAAALGSQAAKWYHRGSSHHSPRRQSHDDAERRQAGGCGTAFGYSPTMPELGACTAALIFPVGLAIILAFSTRSPACTRGCAGADSAQGDYQFLVFSPEWSVCSGLAFVLSGVAARNLERGVAVLGEG